MSEAANWYTVQTQTGLERKAQKSIEDTVANQHMSDVIQKVVVPFYIETGKNGKEVEKRLSYIFVKIVPEFDTQKQEMHLAANVYQTIRRISEVRGFVGPDGKPTPLRPEEVARLKLDGDVVIQTTSVYKKDDSIEIINGVFAGYSGCVETVYPDDGTVDIWINFAGANSLCNLPMTDVKPL